MSAAARASTASLAPVANSQPRGELNSGPGTGTECAEGAGSPPQPAPSFTTITLPAPPSANNLFVNRRGGGRAKSAEYTDWLLSAGWHLRLQKPQPIHGHVAILAGLERDDARSDLDNRLKAPLDLLVKHRVIEDDRHVLALAAAWLPAGEGLLRLLIVPAIAPLFVHYRPLDGWRLPLPQEEP